MDRRHAAALPLVGLTALAAFLLLGDDPPRTLPPAVAGAHEAHGASDPGPVGAPSPGTSTAAASLDDPGGSEASRRIYGGASALAVRAQGQAAAARPRRGRMRPRPPKVPAGWVRVDARPFLGVLGRPLRTRLTIDPGPPDPHAQARPAAKSFEVELDATGRPRLGALPPGRWTISFVQPSGDELRGWSREVDTARGPVTLSFDARGQRGQLAGRILARLPDSLVQVALRPAALREGAFGFLAARAVGADGRFKFSSVPPGRYRVLASWDGGAVSTQAEVTIGRTAWVELGS